MLMRWSGSTKLLQNWNSESLEWRLWKFIKRKSMTMHNCPASTSLASCVPTAATMTGTPPAWSVFFSFYAASTGCAGFSAGATSSHAATLSILPSSTSTTYVPRRPSTWRWRVMLLRSWRWWWWRGMVLWWFRVLPFEQCHYHLSNV